MTVVRPVRRCSSRLRRSSAGALIAVALAACGTTVPGAGSASAGLTSSDGTALSGPASGAAAAGSAPGTVPGSTAGSRAATAPGASGQVGAGSSGAGSSGAGGASAEQPRSTADTVELGITVPYDNTGGSNYGFKGVGKPDVHGYAKAVIDSINRSGGVLGRKIVGVYAKEAETDIVDNPDGTAQATCTAFTQDAHVAFAVVLDPIADDSPNFYQCMKNARTPFISDGAYAQTQSSYAGFAPYLHILRNAALDHLAPVLTSRLKTRGYFEGWDPLTSGPGTLPVTFGLLLVNRPSSASASRELAAALKRVGVDSAITYTYADPNSQGVAAALQTAAEAAVHFKADGVTHMFADTEGALQAFASAAAAQNYFPRYAVDTMNDLQGLAANVPASELKGAMGVGWDPVDDTGAVPGTAAAADCLALMKHAGLDPAADGSVSIALAICDEIQIFAAGARAGGGFGASQLAAGLAKAGATVATALTLRGALSPTRLDNVGAVKDIAFSSSCSCWAYSSSQLIAVN